MFSLVQIIVTPYSLVLSRLDYCNSILSGCPQNLLDRLQKVQDAAARLVCKAKKSDHIRPMLQRLHRLPVTHRILYKISTICFNALSGKSLQYLFILFVCLFLSYGPFNCISFHKFSRQLSAFSLCSSSLDSACISLYESFLSPDIIHCA